MFLSFVNNSRRIHFELSDGRQGPTRARSEMCMGLHGFLLKCLDFTHLNLPDNYKCDRTLKKKVFYSPYLAFSSSLLQ